MDTSNVISAPFIRGWKITKRLRVIKVGHFLTKDEVKVAIAQKATELGANWVISYRLEIKIIRKWNKDRGEEVEETRYYGSGTPVIAVKET